MPLPNDSRLTALSKDLIQALDDIGGVHPGFRPAHAKGAMLTGVFTPSLDAKSLTRAPHAARESTPVTVRFSDSTGSPEVADNDAAASPRGLAVRFHLAEHVHTDIIGHSVDAFPVRTAEEFLEFLRAARASGPDAAKPSPIESFIQAHPFAGQFLQTPKPIPSSFARESYFSVVAYKFLTDSGTERFGRYRISGAEGNHYLSDEELKGKGPNFLFDEVAERLRKAPIRLRIGVQVANAGDTVDDVTKRWPEDRQVVDFGTVELTELVPANDAEARKLIFDPIPRVDGIESSGDPLLEPRAAVYLMSGRRRRAADQSSDK